MTGTRQKNALTTAYALGKVILFGEHAVVYGQPAIAVPVTKVRACATVEDAEKGQGMLIYAVDLQLHHRLGSPISGEHPAYPFEVTVQHTLQRLNVAHIPDITVTISSTVPIARGMGSGAAVATAIVRALSLHLGQQLSAQEVSDLVYQTEVIHHGTPSGIDNTVIAFERPVYFTKGRPIEFLQVKQPFWLVIGDTGISSPTKEVVGDVRRAWQAEPARYQTLFDRIGAIALQAREAIESGEVEALGGLMDENQECLRAIGVSSLELEKLIRAACEAGALGAKLCGAGRGGNMIALVRREQTEHVAMAIREVGASNVIACSVGNEPYRPLA